MTNRLYSRVQAAEMLGYKPAYITALAYQGRLKSLKMNGRYRFTDEHIKEYKEKYLNKVDGANYKFFTNEAFRNALKFKLMAKFDEDLILRKMKTFIAYWEQNIDGVPKWKKEESLDIIEEFTKYLSNK